MNGITTERIDPRTAVVNPGSEVDVQHAAALRNTLLELHSNGVTQYVINLADVEFVDSTGLSVLYRAWRRAIHGGGGLTLASPSDLIRKTLAAVNFPAMVNDTVGAALHRTMATGPALATKEN